MEDRQFRTVFSSLLAKRSTFANRFPRKQPDSQPSLRVANLEPGRGFCAAATALLLPIGHIPAAFAANEG
jgi:hypothetical protein